MKTVWLMTFTLGIACLIIGLYFPTVSRQEGYRTIYPYSSLSGAVLLGIGLILYSLVSVWAEEKKKA